jgi:hypothetical protein
MNVRSNKTWVAFDLGDHLFAGTTVRTEGAEYALHTAENDQEYRAAVRARLALSEKTGFPSLVTLRQTHSCLVLRVDGDNLSNYLADPLIEGDGLYTSLPGVLLGILTADCLPVFITDSEGSFAGIVHAGRAGVEKGIHLELARKVREDFGIAPFDLRVFVGPHIRACCYEVGPETAEGWSAKYVEEHEGRLYLKLERRVMDELADSGVPTEALRSCGYCTRCSEKPSFWSYRAGHRKERMLSFIGRAG